MVPGVSEFLSKLVVISITEKSIDFIGAEVFEADLDGDVFCHCNEILRAEISLDRIFNILRFSQTGSLIFSRKQLRKDFLDI